jgi:hypothetical protein
VFHFHRGLLRKKTSESGRSCKSVLRTIILRKSVCIQTLSQLPKGPVTLRENRDSLVCARKNENRRTRAQAHRLDIEFLDEVQKRYAAPRNRTQHHQIVSPLKELLTQPRTESRCDFIPSNCRPSLPLLEYASSP